MNIRKFTELSVKDLHPRLNVFVGSNAEGKTTLLEALSILTHLSSFRTSKLQELVQTGRDEAALVYDLLSPSASQVLISFQGSRRHIQIDGKASNTKTRYPYLGSSVSFVPDDLYLVKGGPDQRREFLNQVGISLDAGFLEVLHRFERVLTQRNKLLKAIKNREGRGDEFGLWTESLVEASIPLYRRRQHTVSLLNSILPKIYQNLFQVSEQIEVRYQTQFESEEDWVSDESLRQAVLARLRSLEDAERAVGYSLLGPHKDDLDFRINGLAARSYGSQGQIRGLVIALKIAQLELTKTYRAWSPILLLDDIISELDDHRVHALVEYLANYPGQLFVTTAEINKVRALHERFSSFKLVPLGSLSENAQMTAELSQNAV